MAFHTAAPQPGPPTSPPARELLLAPPTLPGFISLGRVLLMLQDRVSHSSSMASFYSSWYAPILPSGSCWCIWLYLPLALLSLKAGLWSALSVTGPQDQNKAGTKQIINSLLT